MSNWVFSTVFLIRKDIDSGMVEAKLKELGSSVEIHTLQKQRLAEETPVEGN